MKTPEKPTILTAPIDALPVIPELKDFMKAKSLATLKEMSAIPALELLNMEGFGYRCLLSYMNVLRDYGCMGRFRE